MPRENGFIVLDDVLNKLGIDTTNLDTIIKSDGVTEITDSSSTTFSFLADGKRLYFKTSDTKNLYNCYAELLAEELAKDYGLKCAKYDLAKVGNHIGVISEDIKIDGATYTDLDEIINMYHDDIWENFYLESIWDDLNEYYKDRPDKNAIVRRLMDKIVDKFVFDALICQLDSSNLKIMEYNGKVDIAPIFDNEYMQYERKEYAFYFGADEKINVFDEFPALSAFNRFLNISSREFVNRVVDKMWIISDVNLRKKFDIVERRTGNQPVPDDIKNAFLSRFSNYRKEIIKVLNRYLDVPVVESRKR